MPWHCPASSSHKFSLLLLIPWVLSKLVKHNYWNLLFFTNTGPCDSDCSQRIPAYSLRSSKRSAHTASGILEHSKVLFWLIPFLLSINHASSQKNSSLKYQKTCWILILETAYNIDFLLPNLKERVLASLEVSMVVWRLHSSGVRQHFTWKNSCSAITLHDCGLGSFITMSAEIFMVRKKFNPTKIGFFLTQLNTSLN